MLSVANIFEESGLEKDQETTTSTESELTWITTRNTYTEYAAEQLKRIAADIQELEAKLNAANAEPLSTRKQIERRPDGSKYPSGWKLALVTLALCLGVLLIALDDSIITTAIPHITDDFDSLEDVGWYGSAYLLTTASLQLLYGKFYSYLNVKWVFIAAISIFDLGSLICGAAPNSTALIAGRAIAGVGAAGIMSGAMMILALSVPLRQRPTYGGILASMYGISSVSGPLLGGVFTDKATWRWCFYINLPIGVVTFLAIMFFFEPPSGATTEVEMKLSREKTWREVLNEFDPIGSAVFMPAIICLLLALQWGGTTYAWNSWRIILCLTTFSVLILIFAYIQHRQQDHATIPPRVLGMRTVWAGSFFTFTAIGASFFVAIYFLPIWFQAVKGQTAVQSGIDNLPLLITAVVMSIVAGVSVSIIGYYTPLMIASTVLMAVGYGLASTLKPDSRPAFAIGYQVLAGAGMGLGMQQPMVAMGAVLSEKDISIGTSMIVFMQTIGGALFVSVAENIFNNKVASNILKYAPGMDPAVVLSAGAASVQQVMKEQFPQYLDGVTMAYNDAVTHAFALSATLAAISLIGSGLMPWASVKDKNAPVSSA